MADNPKAQKGTKKMAKGPVDQPSDSDESQGDVECDICGVSFSNANAYEIHMQGKKHQKKVAEPKVKAKDMSAGKKKPASDDDEDEDDDDDSSDMHCEVCDKHFSGYISYVTHLKGSLHAKNVKKTKLKQQLGNMPEVLNKDGDDTDDDSILPKPYARCGTCQKEFSGPEPYNMHIKSATHKKKVKQSQAVQTLKTQYEDKAKKSDGDADDDEEFFSKCDVCQKSFSGVVPYKMHMKSGAHKRSLEKKKVAEEVKEFYADDESGYVCKECKKSFTDPLAFKCHLANNNHEKQKAKSALQEFLKDHPEIVFVYPLDKDGSENEGSDDDSESGADSTTYYLICKLCHVSFSGPESAQDHVKSKKHLSAKKEKKLLRLLKEQKKDPAAKSDGKKSKAGNDDKPTTKDISENGNSKSPVSNADDFELI